MIPEPQCRWETWSIEETRTEKRARMEALELIFTECKRKRINERLAVNLAIHLLGPMSRAEVGHVMGLSRERVRQIEETALYRAARNARGMREHLE